MPLGGMITEKDVFGQHLTEPIASNLPCSFVFKQTTIQGQIGLKSEKALSTYLNAQWVAYVYTVFFDFHYHTLLTINLLYQTVIQPHSSDG